MRCQLGSGNNNIWSHTVHVSNTAQAASAAALPSFAALTCCMRMGQTLSQTQTLQIFAGIKPQKKWMIRPTHPLKTSGWAGYMICKFMASKFLILADKMLFAALLLCNLL